MFEPVIGRQAGKRYALGSMAMASLSRARRYRRDGAAEGGVPSVAPFYAFPCVKCPVPVHRRRELGRIAGSPASCTYPQCKPPIARDVSMAVCVDAIDAGRIGRSFTLAITGA